MGKRFNPPPNWPAPPADWTPPPGWQPDPAWGPAPEGWDLWPDESAGTVATLKGWGGKAVEAAQDAKARRDVKVAEAARDAEAHRAREAAQAAALSSSFAPEHAPAPVADPDTLWQGKSRPLKGFGGGRYRLTRSHLMFERGLISTDAQQVPLRDVNDIDVRQSMTQKARGVGDVLIHVRRPGGVETVRMTDVSDPRGMQNAVNRVVAEARAALQRSQNTMTYQHSMAPTYAPPAAPVAASTPDPMEQLRKLGELRDAGILTPEEFETKKAAILARM